MRAVVQRVVRAGVKVDGEEIAHIGHGYAVLLGVSTDDTEADAKTLAEKVAHLRILYDELGKVNRSILDAFGAVLSEVHCKLCGEISGVGVPVIMLSAPLKHGEGL